MTDSEKGWSIFDFDGTGMMEVQKLDESNKFANDEEAVATAITEGVRVIPVEELPANFERKYLGWIDTPENRMAIRKYANRQAMKT